MVDLKKVIGVVGSSTPVVDSTGDSNASSGSPALDSSDGRKRNALGSSNLARSDNMSDHKVLGASFTKMDRVGQGKQKNVVDLTNDEKDAHRVTESHILSMSEKTRRVLPQPRSKESGSARVSTSVRQRSGLLSSASAFSEIEKMTGVELTECERAFIKTQWKQRRLEGLSDNNRKAAEALAEEGEFPNTLNVDKLMRIVSTLLQLASNFHLKSCSGFDRQWHGRYY